ncbi:MAG: hypothetical protein AB8H79_05950, partial [Myxococcota bacterium]
MPPKRERSISPPSKRKRRRGAPEPAAQALQQEHGNGAANAALLPAIGQDQPLLALAGQQQAQAPEEAGPAGPQDALADRGAQAIGLLEQIADQVAALAGGAEAQLPV